MRTLKKSIAIILAIIILMSMSTVALAAENTNGVVNITMSYELQSVNRFIKALDTAKITVRVENISGHDLTGVTVAADSDRLYLKKGETGKLEIGTLKADDSAEYSFKAMIRPNDKSLTFSGWGSDLIDLSDGKYTLKSAWADSMPMVNSVSARPFSTLIIPSTVKSIRMWVRLRNTAITVRPGSATSAMAMKPSVSEKINFR